ncbi:hypothetical protein [Mycobacterium intracellulare]|uniref:Uncharacterized protein n=1 Tax=Mycobacterium intracellulare TaxID=1767 RepID=A0AAE4RD64_MYCIT|nr:hypothetical protein [Mycobacterium intracellulare]MDV6975313.1 hypothetical protein [Mycobacterium intracellulare]MDV6980377.1 hypothetical protein [Mycobacterium intracellulare]MDV7010806.1 hypothetical protein [Mycobacterium intracellulare]MDV7025712.1 hypothetical protein [Mycobacterium intracellulare]
MKRFDVKKEDDPRYVEGESEFDDDMTDEEWRDAMGVPPMPEPYEPEEAEMQDVPVDFDRLKRALDYFTEIEQRKDRFIEENQDPAGDEPKCGYAEWDETITDFNYDLADAGEGVAYVLREFLASERYSIRDNETGEWL